jgi:hypothetical protein
METPEVMAAVSPKVAALGSAFYFDPATLAKGKELGLDGFRLYFLGRGGVLGDVAPIVVQAAFGYFAPGLVDKIWTSAKEKASPSTTAHLYLEACADFGRSRLGDVEGLDEFCDAAETVLANTDPAGLALYAGIRSQPMPDDAPGRAMHLIAVMRELRGSAHLVAVRAVGLDVRLAHQIKRGEDDAKMFGWEEPHLVITDADRALHDDAERLTDAILHDSFAALSAEQAAALVAGVERIEAAVAAG